MNTVIALLFSASSAFVTPTPDSDVQAFIQFLYASERCPGVNINFEKTLEQISDLGASLKWDDNRTRDKILVETRIAEFRYQQNRSDFCDEVRNTYDGYDPAYLKQVGVVN